MRRPFTIRGDEPVYSALGPEVRKKEQALKFRWVRYGQKPARLWPIGPALYYGLKEGWVKAPGPEVREKEQAVRLCWVGKCGSRMPEHATCLYILREPSQFPIGPALYYGGEQGWVKA